MSNQTIRKFNELRINELSVQELSHIHLSFGKVLTLDKIVISTLAVAYGNIRSAMINVHSNTLIPLMSMMAVLEQLGKCYSNKQKVKPLFENDIKKCLYYFGGFDEYDQTLKTLCALRNGLLHNVSLTSYDKKSQRHYYFVYDDSITTIIKESKEIWDGDYDKLDGSDGEYLTFVSVPNLLKLVDDCIAVAKDLNSNGDLRLNLPYGKKQLYFDYIRAIPTSK